MKYNFNFFCSDLEVTLSASEFGEDQVDSCPEDVEDMDIVQSYSAEIAEQCIETCPDNAVECDECVEATSDTTGEPADVINTTVSVIKQDIVDWKIN